MKLVYSNAITIETEQTNPTISLGGWMSNTPIPNSTVSNIFPPVSNFGLKNKKSDIRLICIWNNSSVNYLNTTVKFVLDEESLFTYEFALVTPTLCDGKQKYELLADAGSIPFYATLSDVESETEYSVGEIIAGESIGIWIRRNYITTPTKKKSIFVNTDDCDLWKAEYAKLVADESQEIKNNEIFDIVVSYTEEESSSTSGSFSLS